MKAVLTTTLKLIWGAYFFLCSGYCLLGYLPYTYFFVVKNPPYEWVSAFAHHQIVFYWVALLVAAVAFWPRENKANAIRPFLWLLAAQFGFGIYLAFRPFMASLQNDSNAFTWGLVCLVPILLMSIFDLVCAKGSNEIESREQSLIAYSVGGGVATLVSLSYSLGSQVRSYSATHQFGFSAREAELAGWSLISHLLIAVAVVTAINLLRMATSKLRLPNTTYFALLGLSACIALQRALVFFFETTFSFRGLGANAYALALASSLVVFAFSLASPLWQQRKRPEQSWTRIVLAVAAIGMGVFAVFLPSIVGNGDFNGILIHTFTLFFWLGASFCVYRLLPRKPTYSVTAICGVLILAALAYKGLEFSSIVWAKPIGETDEDIARAFEEYGSSNASFGLVQSLLAGGHPEECGGLCRVMRDNTNIPHPEAKRDLNLVESLNPTTAHRPNIFIFVIDSLRADYLGVYNPKVDFSPNLDAFARDSVTIRNAYTQYAGTSLSEPAIWSGALLLHAHWLQPFYRVNSLQKLADTDNYQLVVSYDEILQQLLPASSNVTKLDTNVAWNRLDVCTTTLELENLLDSRSQTAAPIFFYSQPKNVHELSNADLPKTTGANWHFRPGFNSLAAFKVQHVDECMGKFFDYLKSRKQFEDSLIIVTSDHGHAMGGERRSGHAYIIYPEIMHVPMIIHLPKSIRDNVVYDEKRVSTLTDIAPSLYYLLGHKPIVHNALFGRPMFMQTKEELDSYPRTEVLLATDLRAAYGILSGDGRYFYVAYDYPPNSMLFDLVNDPAGEHNILNDQAKQYYDRRIVENLNAIANFYDYKPKLGELFVQASK